LAIALISRRTTLNGDTDAFCTCKLRQFGQNQATESKRNGKGKKRRHVEEEIVNHKILVRREGWSSAESSEWIQLNVKSELVRLAPSRTHTEVDTDILSVECGKLIDVFDGNRWCVGRVKSCSPGNSIVDMTYVNWESRFDTTLNSEAHYDRIAPLRTHTSE
jgi:hypothetical protein